MDLKRWIAPFVVMAGTGLVLDKLLDASHVSVAGYFAAIALYSMLCGAYIAIHVAYEDPTWRARHARRRARHGGS